jgi:hypothetical protein
MSDRRIKSASGSDTGGFFTARRLALAEEANFPADDDKKHRRSWRHSTLLYPSTRVRAVYGAMLLLLFYTVAVPALSKQRDTALALGATSPGAGQPLPPGGRRRAKWSERDVAPTDPKHPHTVVDGMLVVNPDATLHPIHQLINTARTDWAAKVARQSKSLEEAVIEYKRRNKRPPPPGFDRWWDYVV